MQTFFASTAKGIELLLKQELIELGALDVKETRAGVEFTGDIALAYRVCLWSRLANHVLFPILKFSAANQFDLYRELQEIDWLEHIASNGSFRIDVDGKHDFINNTQFIAQKAKDAIVDQIRNKLKARPNIQMDEPDVVVHVYVSRQEFVVSISLSGESLHKRGYRLEGGRAPLKENLAAAILIRSGWMAALAKGQSCLIDPMCGSGTLLIEAAMMAYDIAPGINRNYFGFMGWRGHRASIWQKLLEDANTRRDEKLANPFTEIMGFDVNSRALEYAEENITRANLHAIIKVQQQDAGVITREGINSAAGLIVCNPPYGERLQKDEEDALKQLFSDFGKALREHFNGWELAIFSGSPQLLKSLGIRSYKIYKLFNGALPCELLKFHLTDEYFMRFESLVEKQARRAEAILANITEQGRMFAHRLEKNAKHLSKWAKRSDITCYRIYDADLPDYAIAIDKYQQWIHVQEYQADKEIDPKKAERRLYEALALIEQTLQIPRDHIFLKVRQKQKGDSQYEKLSDEKHYDIIHEGLAKFYVNFTDYLDTGLFLDHRLMRQKVAKASCNKTFLNLFAYTCTASVHAALMGAKQVTSVDLSNTYLDWGKRNFSLNHIDPKFHRFIQADCLQWLASNTEKFDVIFLDPPTFSNSKRMEGILDIQRDHVALVELAMKHLQKNGVLFFSNNYRRFKLDSEALAQYSIEDISHACLPEDFKRRPNIHHCWCIQHKNGVIYTK